MSTSSRSSSRSSAPFFSAAKHISPGSFSDSNDARGSDSQRPVTLYIRVVEADKFQNPLYMRIWGALIVQLEWEGGSHETTVKEHTAHPVWDEAFECKVLPQGTMVISLIDKDWLGLDIPVGTQVVKVRDLLRSSRLDLALTDPDHGEITASLLLLVGRKEGAVDADDPKRLVLHVGQGRHLGGPVPLLHPRLVIKIGNQQRETLARPSAVLVNWGEDLEFEYLDEQELVHVHLKDGPATVGRGRLTVRDVLGIPEGKWLKLQDPKQQPAGDVHLSDAKERSLHPPPPLPDSSPVSNSSESSELAAVAGVPIRLVRATNAAFGTSGPLYCLLKKDQWSTETLATDASPNIVWNADVQVPMRSEDSLQVEMRQAGGRRSLGRAVVPNSVLTSGEREVWVHVIAAGRRSGELCLSLSTPPLTYRAPRRPPANYPSIGF